MHADYILGWYVGWVGDKRITEARKLRWGVNRANQNGGYKNTQIEFGLFA